MNIPLLENVLKFGIRHSLPRWMKTSRIPYCTSVSSNVQTPTSSPPVIIQDLKYDKLRLWKEEPRQAWVESFTSAKAEQVGLVTLHPDVFGAVPRLDILKENLRWQLKYKDINYVHTKIPVEVRGRGKGYGRKPWPQKRTGRARQGSTVGPHWHKGGVVHGPRKFTTSFYMLDFNTRLLGLVSMISCKFTQDDLKIVSSLDIPTEDGSFLEEVVEERSWGDSVLFVDADDIMPENITKATDEVPHFNILPVYGLNVHSMLKHDTLVLTLAALDLLQERLLTHLHGMETIRKGGRYRH